MPSGVTTWIRRWSAPERGRTINIRVTAVLDSLLVEVTINLFPDVKGSARGANSG